MKIDRSFVRDIETDSSDRAIIQTIVGMARSLDVLVVGEGVETETQAVLLRQFGCDAFQGYLFGRPMPLADFLSRLRKGETLRLEPPADPIPALPAQR
jgi:EAL domain-containing protein (putative c-di-GMP-specific phosphodiesterase class I)